jgi:hypothetical protein
VTTEAKKHAPTSAATDVPQLISELDVGTLETAISIALSDTAASVIDHNKTGEVVLKFKIEKIDGTHQVRMEHLLKFTKPTASGKAGEETKGVTVLHVGKYGRLSIAPEAQLSMFDKSTGQPAT